MLELGGVKGTFSGGVDEVDEGVGGGTLGTGLFGPPGLKGTSVLTGAVELLDSDRKSGSELRMSFLPAKHLYEMISYELL